MDDDLRAVTPVDDALFGDVAGLIDSAHRRVAASVNSELVMLHWSVGHRVREDVLGRQRAEYGAQVVERLAARFTERYGRGWSRQNLERMVRVAHWLDRPEKCSPLASQLTWTNITELLTISDQRKRDFYLAFCAHERWSKRTLRAKIADKLYERTLAARGSAEGLEADLAALSSTGTVEPSVAFRDPYVLDFLGLPTKHSESDLEQAILDDMQRFLLELGAGFAFVARQKRIVVDGEDHYLDLLFYHVRMRCYVAVELKTRKLRAGDKGQMELYCAWLDRHERMGEDASTLGLILCAAKGAEQVDLLGLGDGAIRAARYLTEPMRERMRKRLEAAACELPEGGA